MPLLVVIGIFYVAVNPVDATALTTYLSANEKSCFYADVDGEILYGIREVWPDNCFGRLC